MIATDMTGPVKEKYDRLIAEGLSPMRRWGQPEDVARAVTALVAGHFPFSTGERINVDGGFIFGRTVRAVGSGQWAVASGQWLVGSGQF